MCLAQGQHRSDTGEARTRGLLVSSQALYHWVTVLPIQRVNNKGADHTVRMHRLVSTFGVRVQQSQVFSWWSPYYVYSTHLSRFETLLMWIHSMFTQGNLIKNVFHITCTVKHVLSRHSKIDKTKVLMEYGSLMKVESIAECSQRSKSGRLRQVLL